MGGGGGKCGERWGVEKEDPQSSSRIKWPPSAIDLLLPSTTWPHKRQSGSIMLNRPITAAIVPVSFPMDRCVGSGTLTVGLSAAEMESPLCPPHSDAPYKITLSW